MKTILSNSAQKANMRSAHKNNKTATTPNTERKKNDESTSGKKLVQARLPFKILSGTPSSKPEEGTVPSTAYTNEVPSKKRKLSYTDEPDVENKIGKSGPKENLTTREKIDSDPSCEVIVLDEDESEEELSQKTSSPKTPNTAVGFKNKKRKNTPRSKEVGASTSTTPKLQIKLPLSGKKKRKSKRASLPTKKTDATDSSDIEISDDQNPQKKLKLEEAGKDDDAPEQGSTSIKSGEEKGISHKEKEKASGKTSSPLSTPASSKPNTDEEKQSHMSTEPQLQTPKSSKQSRYSPKSSKALSIQSNENGAKEQPNKTSNSPTKPEIYPEEKKEDKESSEMETKQNDVTPQKQGTTNSIISKGTCVEEGPNSTNEAKSSRRSTRISENEKNKKENENENEKELSSEPEFVSEKTNVVGTPLNVNGDLSNKSLTPKQLKLMEQRKKAREEKELKLQQLKEERERKLQEQREERERKLQEEKAQKQKEREERELQRKKEREEREELKRREREEKEDQRRKEKEDKERKRMAEIEAKNEEKRKKDEVKEEERRKKEDERRRKELEKEEEENKKKKAAQAFTKFFVPKAVKPVIDEDQESRDDAESVDSLAFRPFQIKGAMKLAPLVRREFNEHSREKLDSFLKSNEVDKSALYIDELKGGSHTPLRGFKTVLKNNDEDEDDVVIVDNVLENAGQAIDEPRDLPIQKFKAKYYFFRENRRPPFYGTWRKKSAVITPRKPFATDKTFFDYEVDSDDEWEEEEPGESLTGSDDEKDESEDEDYEVDNEWFVPHGHLSDEELQNEDELGPDTSREAQKAKLKALQQEFAQEMKKKTEKIKPRLVGTIWEDENGNRPKLCPAIIWDSLCTRAMIFCEPPIMEEPEVAEPEPNTPPPEKQKRIEIDEELMKDLVRLVHGNRHSKVFLIKEYMEHVSNICATVKNGECLAPTKSQIKEKIDEISDWSVVDAVNKKQKNKKKLCWVVAPDILDKYALGNLGLRNEWSYKLRPKFDKDTNDNNAVQEPEKEITKTESSEDLTSTKIDKNKSKTSGIAKFAKVLTKEEKQSQLASKERIVSTKSTASSSPKISKEIVSASSGNKVQKNTTTPAAKKTLAMIPVNKTPVVKKRVPLLMSVPPGQHFSPQSKNALISQFLQKNKTSETVKSIASTENVKSDSDVPHISDSPMDVDEVVMLD